MYQCTELVVGSLPKTSRTIDKGHHFEIVGQSQQPGSAQPGHICNLSRLLSLSSNKQGLNEKNPDQERLLATADRDSTFENQFV